MTRLGHHWARLCSLVVLVTWRNQEAKPVLVTHLHKTTRQDYLDLARISQALRHLPTCHPLVWPQGRLLATARPGQGAGQWSFSMGRLMKVAIAHREPVLWGINTEAPTTQFLKEKRENSKVACFTSYLTYFTQASVRWSSPQVWPGQLAARPHVPLGQATGKANFLDGCFNHACKK